MLIQWRCTAGHLPELCMHGSFPRAYLCVLMSEVPQHFPLLRPWVCPTPLLLPGSAGDMAIQHTRGCFMAPFLVTAPSPVFYTQNKAGQM